ncbi:MAG: hypothetical protein HY909_21325 [Deltaproteobacteria bacterium]|nr:hypothetical protein [Deltaproteobacteria bacterium]
MDTTLAGGITLGAGALALVGGLVVLLSSRPENQPGTSTQWSPAAPWARGPARRYFFPVPLPGPALFLRSPE